MQSKLIYGLLVAATLTACSGSTSHKSLAEGASGNIDAYENADVNAAEQARATVMIIPSDNLLKRYGALTLDGENVTRDYAKYLVMNNDNKAVISVVQQAFANANYPVQSLEQMLKQLSTQEATDMVDGIGKDAKTQLLTVAQPDIIVEIDYQSPINMRGAVNTSHNVTYTMNAIDAYTNEVLSSTSMHDLKGESVAGAISESIAKAMPKFLTDVQKHFSDILTRGRNVTIRVAIDGDSNVSLSDESIAGDTYADWILDYVKTHTVKGAYKMQRNTNKELCFVNCRIPLLNDDGTQYGVYDWARDMSKSMHRNLGVKCSNKAQGLGEIVITINGIK
jgi:hypothetical protein